MTTSATPGATTAAPIAEAVTFTGVNAAEIRDLGVHVVEHPTQDAIVVFPHEGALDPVGICAVGQVVENGKRGIRIVGRPDITALALPDDDRFDPSKANVEDVLSYLETLDEADEDEAAEKRRVIQLERDGKNRKSIVG